MDTSFINKNTLEESFQYVNPDFPLRVYSGIDECLDYVEYPLHWHNEIEITCVVSGRCDYYINSGMYKLQAGDVIVINSKVLHKIHYYHSTHYKQKGVLFSPDLLLSVSGNSINFKYVLPVINDKSLECIIIRNENANAKTILNCVENITNSFFTLKDKYELRMRNALSQIWMILLDNVSNSADVDNTDNMRMRKMIAYINGNYNRQIGLSDIAAAAIISERECSRCFRRVVDQTPINYLNTFRINQAKEYLFCTEMPVSEIASKIGFVSSAYFVSVFKKFTGMSPTEYRKSRSK